MAMRKLPSTLQKTKKMILVFLLSIYGGYGKASFY